MMKNKVITSILIIAFLWQQVGLAQPDLLRALAHAEKKTYSANYEKIFARLTAGLRTGTAGIYDPLVIDGLPGAGKSTFSNMYQEYLAHQGNNVVYVQSDWFLKPTGMNLLVIFFLGIIAPRIPFLPYSWVRRMFINYFCDQERLSDFIRWYQETADSLRQNPDGIYKKTIYINPSPDKRLFWKAMPLVPMEITLQKNTFVVMEGLFSTDLFGQLGAKRLLIDADIAVARRRLLNRLRIAGVPPLKAQFISRLAITRRTAISFRQALNSYDYVVDTNNVNNPIFIASAISEPGAGILIVSQNKATYSLFDTVLGKKGYAVIWAPDGKAALSVLKNQKVSLIISDIDMPEMDGVALAGELQERHPEIPVILRGERQDAKDFSLNVADVFPKDLSFFDMPVIPTRVERAMHMPRKEQRRSHKTEPKPNKGLIETFI